MKTQLLCTFCSKYDFDDTIELIKLAANVVFNKIYVFENVDDGTSLICTYNVEKTEDFIQNSKTMAIHRKKETNTLYTINALNEAIRKENDGVLDKSYSLNWESYKNSLLLTNDKGLNIVRTKLYKIVDV
jgi:thymidylate synthase